MQDETLLSVTVITDDDTGMYAIGELDFGIHGGLEDHIRENGTKDVLNMLDYLKGEVEKIGAEVASQGTEYLEVESAITKIVEEDDPDFDLTDPRPPPPPRPDPFTPPQRDRTEFEQYLDELTIRVIGGIEEYPDMLQGVVHLLLEHYYEMLRTDPGELIELYLRELSTDALMQEIGSAYQEYQNDH